MKSAARWVIVSLLAFGIFPLSVPALAAAPTATSVSPSAGSKFGGNTVTIAGSDLSTTGTDAILSIQLSASNSVSAITNFSVQPTAISAVIPVLNPPATGSAQIIITFSGSNVVTLPYSLINAFATESSLASAPAIGSFSTIIRGFSFSNNVATAVISTSRAVVPATFAVLDDFEVSVSIPVLSAAQIGSDAFIRLTFTDGSPASFVPIELVGPTVSAIVPASGTAAGGTAITISGEGFLDGNGQPAVSKILLGSDLISDFTVVSDTTISATVSARTGNNKTVGANRVAVFYADDVSNSDVVFFYFTPVREASQDVASLVMLGELASRSNRKPVFRTSQRPFVVTGTDSQTKQSYQYETNFGYTGRNAYTREGHQPGYTKKLVNGSLVTIGMPRLNAGTGATINTLAKGEVYSNRGAMPQDSTILRSAGGCGENINSFDAGDGQGVTESYCTVFGPEIYSETFYGKAGQSLGFNWLAIGDQDDYSVYGYLVAVSNENVIPKTDAASHTLVTHGVGSRDNAADDSVWTAAVADIPEDGLYRFRFTNGSYDGTGGFVIGSTFIISSVYEAGLTNGINFGPIGDQLLGQANDTFQVNASALSGGQVTVVSRTASVCTVGSSFARPTTTVTITKKTTGTCILVASRGLDGEYAPAADKMVAFDIRASAVAPTAPVITQVNSGDKTLTVLFVAPSRDGGSAITSYEYSTDGGATWASASPTSTATTFTITSLSSDVTVALTNGVTYSLQVRAVSSVYPGAASNTADGVPNAPALPNLAYASATVTRTVGVVTSILAPANTGGVVTTYSYSGTLTPGLTLNTSTGIISGNPSQVGSSTIQLTGANSTGTSSAVTLTIVIQAVAANPPAISWPAGIIGEYTAYVGTVFTSDTPANSNTVDSAAFAIAPGLPAGLSINTSTGVVSGTASVTSSSVAYVVTATNGAGSSTISFILTVLPAQAGSTGGAGSSGSTYNGPEITLITPNVVNTAGGQLIRVEGRRLGTGNHVTLAGIRVQLQSSTATSFTFIMPALSVQVLDMLYTYDGGARLTYMNAITVVALVVPPVAVTESPVTTPVTPKPTPKPWSAIGIASKFAPGSAVVNSAVRAQVNQMLRLYASRATTIQCTGFTMGPSVLRVDAKLSRDRAQAVCRLIKQLRPRLTVISATGRQELRLGGEVRRVEVLFRAR
jgi:hypothetical protein